MIQCRIIYFSVFSHFIMMIIPLHFRYENAHILLLSFPDNRKIKVNGTRESIEFKSNQWFGATVRAHKGKVVVSYFAFCIYLPDLFLLFQSIIFKMCIYTYMCSFAFVQNQRFKNYLMCFILKMITVQNSKDTGLHLSKYCLCMIVYLEVRI